MTKKSNNLMSIEITDGFTMEPVDTFEFKVAHFRLYDKKKILKNGGYTTITFVNEGLPFVMTARCSANETYSRKKGIFECIRKYCNKIHNKELLYLGKDPTGGYNAYVTSISKGETQ